MSKSDINFLLTLENVIQERLQRPADDSYTSSLVASGRKRIAQKVGEESVELALAAVSDDRAEIIEEAADLLYHVLVLLNNQGVTLADVTATLEARHT